MQYRFAIHPLTHSIREAIWDLVAADWIRSEAAKAAAQRSQPVENEDESEAS